MSSEWNPNSHPVHRYIELLDLIAFATLLYDANPETKPEIEALADRIWKLADPQQHFTAIAQHAAGYLLNNPRLNNEEREEIVHRINLCSRYFYVFSAPSTTDQWPEPRVWSKGIMGQFCWNARKVLCDWLARIGEPVPIEIGNRSEMPKDLAAAVPAETKSNVETTQKGTKKNRAKQTKQGVGRPETNEDNPEGN